MHRELIFESILILKLFFSQRFKNSNTEAGEKAERDFVVTQKNDHRERHDIRREHRINRNERHLNILFLSALLICGAWLYHRLVSSVDRYILLTVLLLESIATLRVIFRHNTPSPFMYNHLIITDLISIFLMMKLIHDKYLLRKKFCNYVV